MAIKIDNDRIQFTNYAIRITPRGLSVVTANSNTTANLTTANVGYTNSFQGENYGFVAGGVSLPSVTNTIDKFSLVTYEYATDVGDLTESRFNTAGASSSTYGYAAGGSIGVNRTDTIDKFQFASNRNATDVGNLTAAAEGAAGVSSTSSGYVFGGVTNPGAYIRSAQKFPFASDSNAVALTGIGPLRDYLFTTTPPTYPPTTVMWATRGFGTGITDIVNGYGFIASGYGAQYSPATTGMLSQIERFSTITDTASPYGPVDSGPAFLFINATRNVVYGAGLSSKTHGYIAGGSTTFPGITSISSIQKFPFAIYAATTTVADLYVQAYPATPTYATFNVYGGAGISAEHSGYVAGGANNSVYLNTVDKFPFATDIDAIDVTDLSVARSQGTGHQF